MLKEHCLRATLCESRFDTKMFWFEISGAATFFKGTGVNVTIHEEKAVEEKIVVDDTVRKAYRLGGMDHGTFTWLTLDAGLFGGKSGQMVPVYIQPHAIRKLEERLNLDTNIVHWYSFKSMFHKPVIRSTDNDEYLVEYLICGLKAGYFIVGLEGGKLVIKTFLFLTNKGTPEATKLYYRLKLTRQDIEFNSLDTLDAFTKTDLFNDPVIGALLDECGLSSLRKMKDRLQFSTLASAADDLKKYLSIDAEAEERILGEKSRREEKLPA